MDIDELLTIAAERLASDLHVRAGGPPYLRIDGELTPLEMAPFGAPDVERMAFDLMTEEQVRAFKATNESDFAYSLPGIARFRVNAFRQRGSVGIAIRRVLPGSTSFEALGVPSVVETLCEERRGLILVTGMTGSGKTTTTAAMINHINVNRRCHIVTIEDPIEVLHADKQAIVDQREVAIDTADFATALRHVARQDPDVIFIGEMRDPETVKAALSAAETGHLVISTLHTLDATETVNRVIDFFPQSHQHQIRVSLSGVLKGVVCQRLAPRVDGGMIPAVEVMVSNGRIVDRILDSNVTAEIHDIIAQGASYGMQTFDQALLKLVQQDLISIPDAMATASRGHDFGLMLQQAGLVEASLASA
jgi:twitching motility protein PilT